MGEPIDTARALLHSCQADGVIERSTAMACARDLIDCQATITAQQEQIAQLESQNDLLRGLVQCNEDWRCPYGMNVKHITECPHGFPGCSCADDRMAALTQQGAE